MARIDAMTMKIDAQYKEFQSRSKQSNLDDDGIPMSREEEAKFMQTFSRTRVYNDYCDRDSNRDNWHSSGRNNYNRDNYQSHSNDKPDLQKKLNDFINSQHSTNSFVKDTFMDLKNKLETTTKNHQASINLKAKFDKLADKQSSRPTGSLPSNTQPNLKAANLSNESSAILQNIVPPKLGDPGSFLIPCNFNKSFSCNALADLGASINLMPYSLYAKLSLETLKPTKMSVRLADRSFQYPIGIAKNMLVEVGNITFPADFIILEMEEDKEDFDALLNEGSEILHSIEGAILEEKLFAEFDEFMAVTANEDSESELDTEEPAFEKNHF
ncbi:reverse transcriptase domain-containing protein [Tanacetum coccineum]